MLRLGLLHCPLTVIAGEAKQSPSAELGVASSLALLAMTDYATAVMLRSQTIDTRPKVGYTW
jgi:hypothetical protein